MLASSPFYFLSTILFLSESVGVLQRIKFSEKVEPRRHVSCQVVKAFFTHIQQMLPWASEGGVKGA